ncbi:MAG: 23S rRNA (pseudouridine(1915)-N(3))-methyltransferase RlmH [Thermincola sp.]|nr:23S rRNA (pseudouridine(1915)-N(3))-methyltransferase RlmH [Thermincola sp.]MDT3702009.1 23S rRNA (pseudouridine(1915)-N(3))-methyltransferase RlmH [Thermincola sp.]
MNINIIAVGKIKERYLEEGIREYSKRLRPYAAVSISEVADEKTTEGASIKEQELVKAAEAERILRHVKPGQVVVVLAIEGQMLDSPELAQAIASWGLAGKSEVAFVIGGSLGLHKSVMERADLRLSFGKLTYPHQLMRLILTEQIYRAFKINRGEPYHK